MAFACDSTSRQTGDSAPSQAPSFFLLTAALLVVAKDPPLSAVNTLEKLIRPRLEFLRGSRQVGLEFPWYVSFLDFLGARVDVSVLARPAHPIAHASDDGIGALPAGRESAFPGAHVTPFSSFARGTPLVTA